MSVTMETDLPFLSREPDRHGNDRIYVRRNGKRIRIREKERTPEFARAYAEAVDKLGVPKSKRPADGLQTHPNGSLGWLGAEYFKSKGEDGFLRLAKDSRRARRNCLEECFRVPLSDTDPDPMGNCPLKFVSAQKIKRMIEAEDKQSPISDQEIVDRLAGEGIPIARRTVAKYRDALGILASNKRKRVF